MDLNEQKTAFAESYTIRKDEFHEKTLPYKSKLLTFEGLKEGLTSFVIVFFISEILISGGRYEKDIYLWIINLLAIVLIQIYFNRKKERNMGWRFNLLFGVKTAVFYAIFDTLIVGLLLSKGIEYHLNFWGTYASYALLILTPVIYPKIRSYSIRKLTPSNITS